MRKHPARLTGTLACLVLLAAAAPALAQERPDPAAARTAIDAVNRQFEAAFAAHDGVALAALYTEEGQLLPPGSQAVSGREAIAAFWGGAFEAGLEALELHTIELEVRGDLAYEVGHAVLRAGGEVVDEANFVVIWRRDGGEWRLHRDIWNSQRTD